MIAGLQAFVRKGKQTNPLGLAKRCLLGDGLIVPAEEAEDADDESSSGLGSGSS